MWVWPGLSLWLGEAHGGENDPHAHHALQLTFALDGRFRLNTDDELAEGVAAAAVAPDVTHGFAASGLIAHLFVEPESRSGRGLVDKFLNAASLTPLSLAGLDELTAGLQHAWRGADETALAEAAEQLVGALAPPPSARLEPDRRVRLAAEAIALRCQEPLALDEFARVAGLSASRFRHLFAAETGLPFRNYVLWRRLMRAVEIWSDGASLTDAAHGAGFADSSHLSRTFRRMFGQSASTLELG
jgi:AraC-like DNA-binding protein